MSTDSIIGSTLTKEQAQSPKFQGQVGEFSKLTLSGKSVTEITDSGTSESSFALMSAYGISLITNKLAKDIALLTDDVSALSFTPVISDSIINVHFTDNNVELTNFEIELNKALFYNRGSLETEAKIYIQTKAFVSSGTYFVEFVVDELPNGSTLTLTDEKNEVQKVITLAGKYQFELTVPDPSITSLTWTATNVPYGKSVILSYLGIHHVKTVFDAYMEYLAEKFSKVEFEDYVTDEELTAATTLLATELRTYVNTQTQITANNLYAHTAAENPHNITPAMIGAAYVKHTHSVNDIYGLDDDFFQPITVIQAQVDQIAADLLTHKNEINPHGITPNTIGAAAYAHTHHIADIVDINTLTTVIDTIQQKLTNTTQALNTHVSATGNVHNLTTDDLGIKFATTNEAIAGDATTLYMSPKLTRDVINEASTNEAVDFTRVSPQYIGTCVLDNTTNTSVSYPIHEGGIYELVLSDINNQKGLSNVGWYLGDAADTTDYFNNFSTAINGQLYLNVKQDTRFRFVPVDDGPITMHGASGTLSFNTNSMTMNSTIFIKGFDAGTDAVTYGSLAIGSGYMGTTESFSKMTLSIDSTDIETHVQISIYELVQPKDASVIVDASPVGAIVSFYGNSQVNGYGELDGSILPRDNYKDLFDKASVSGRMLSKTDWDELYTSQGSTLGVPYFHTGDGSTTFGIPLHLPKDGRYDFIKIQSVTVPESEQTLYELIWNDETTA